MIGLVYRLLFSSTTLVAVQSIKSLVRSPEAGAAHVSANQASMCALTSQLRPLLYMVTSICSTYALWSMVWHFQSRPSASNMLSSLPYG
eukprot:374035-Pelagomonas_calceolata.AAC.1